MAAAATERFARELERLKRAHGYRALKPASGIDFTSNDYLGLAQHPALREAVAQGLQSSGLAGAGGSRLLRGNHPAHEELEDFAGRFFGTERTLYFGSGFLANLALFSTLIGRHDAVIFDERIHASVKEGMHASPADRYRARHNDLDSFETKLRKARAQGARGVFIAVESIYSMDGDMAPLAEFAALARAHDAMLIVDEAHATGVFDARGRGLGEDLHDANWISLHTCGKALGVSGAVVCASAPVIEYLINAARPFIYSTAPPPFLATAVKRALELVDEEPWRRSRALANAALAHAKLNPGAAFAGSQIVPVILGDEEHALRVAAAVQAAGFDVRAIRPPTVPAGTSRLRVSVNALHTDEQIAGLADAVAAAKAAVP